MRAHFSRYALASVVFPTCLRFSENSTVLGWTGGRVLVMLALHVLALVWLLPKDSGILPQQWCVQSGKMGEEEEISCCRYRQLRFVTF